MNDWNNLPNYVVNGLSINTLKSFLDSYLLNLRFLYKIVALIEYTGCGVLPVFNHNHNHNFRKFYQPVT